MMPKPQQVADCDPAKPDDVAVKIDIETCVQSFETSVAKHDLIPKKADDTNQPSSKKWILIGLLALSIAAVVGMGAALAFHLFTHPHSSPAASSISSSSSSSSSPSNEGEREGAVVDLGGEGLELDSSLTVTGRDIAKRYIDSTFDIQSSFDDIKKCSQGLIPWNTTEKNRDWYIATNLRCSTSEGNIVLSSGEIVGEQVGCIDDGPLPCPKVYDGSLEACQTIAMLSVVGQAYELRFYDGDWITWNEISQECSIYDRDSLCEELVDGDEHDHSFQFCGEGYVASQYSHGDEAHETCEHGALEYSENPWISAKGLACTGSNEDDLPTELFKPGQSVQGCDSAECISIYEGTLDSCHRLAAHSMTGINHELLELHVGGWMSYDEVTGNCFLWSQCGKLSQSSTISSFQYCGVSHKAGGEHYVDYYDYEYGFFHYSDYEYEYSAGAEEEEYPY